MKHAVEGKLVVQKMKFVVEIHVVLLDQHVVEMHVVILHQNNVVQVKMIYVVQKQVNNENSNYLNLTIKSNTFIKYHVIVIMLAVIVVMERHVQEQIYVSMENAVLLHPIHRLFHIQKHQQQHLGVIVQFQANQHG